VPEVLTPITDHKGKTAHAPGAIDAYAYKIDYVNHHTTFHVEKLI
jgi:hypothetical protein